MANAANAEVLARLAAGTVDHTRVSGSDHGGITQSDIAAAMSGMTKFSESILRAKYAGQAEFLAVLRRDLAGLVQRTGMAAKWPVKSPEWLESLLEVAIQDHMGSGKCPSCAGRGSIYSANSVKPCKHCQSTGRESGQSQRHVARVLQLDDRTYRRTWADKYREIKYILMSAENAGLSVMKRRLSR